MKNILTIHEQDIVPAVQQVDKNNYDYRKREAARAIVLDNTGRVALLHVGLDEYHKLPGGGIEEGEDIQTALERELQEEIGCKAKVTGEVGEIVEFRDEGKLQQTSYCFMARQIGEKGLPDFTEKELREQFAIVWAESLESAVALVRNDMPKSYAGKFIQKRDLQFLKTAQESIEA